MQVDFYQLGEVSAERAVTQIAARVVQSGERLLVVASDAARRAAVSEALWAAGPERFLANGEAGGAHDARQPILLAGEVAPGNGARHCALADGVWRDAALDGRFDRAFLFFDGETVGAAREVWRELGGRDGVERRFWKHDGTGWTRAA